MQLKLFNKLMLLAAIAGILGLAACTETNAQTIPPNNIPTSTASGQTPSATPSTPAGVPVVVPAGKIKATWITAVKSGDSVSIPVDAVSQKYIVHFPVDTPSGKENFMAYVFEGQVHVRADICPPCRSINFSLEKNILSCDACGTRFDAKTGAGVSGACVAYPKAAVAFETSGDSLVMKMADLQTAYKNTTNPPRK